MENKKRRVRAIIKITKDEVRNTMGKFKKSKCPVADMVNKL